MPLGLAWLSFRLFLVFAFWIIVAVLPGAAMFTTLVASAPLPDTPVATTLYTFALILAAAAFIAIYCIPFYKYRYVFRLKADNPDWTAGACMKSCRELVYGSKWRIFKHDCSYWRILLLALLPTLVVMATVMLIAAAYGGGHPDGGHSAAAVVVAVFGAAFISVEYLALIVLGVVSAYYIGVGQTILYREISREKRGGISAQASLRLPG